jgi:nucleoside-diphosphate-sugar epimerase
MPNDLIVIAGAGGFIGGHLVADLLRQGCTRIRAVDCKSPDAWWQCFPEVENCQLDLRRHGDCDRALRGASLIYNLAADMGGMGFIENNKALCMLSVLINTHLLMAARDHGVQRYFYASSACVYAADKQTSPDVIPLKEEDAYPAMPEDGYGWEKLFSERMCRHFREDFGLTARVARFHSGLPVSITFTGRMAPGSEAAKKRPRPFAARSPKPGSPVALKLRSGATATRRAVSCTSTTALTASTGSCTATLANQSTSVAMSW